MSETARVPVLDALVDLRLGSLHLSVSVRSASPVVALVGPSGAGKSSFLRAVAGLEPRARGHVRLLGEVWMDSDAGVWVEPWARRVGWVPQDHLLFPHLTVRENLAFGAGDVGEAELAGAAALVEATHLLERRPAVLSGGERQRVALARALLSRPRLLLLDEPFSALDPGLRGELTERLRSYLEQTGVPTVLVSHDQEDARRLGCQEFHLVEGQLAR